MRAYPVTPLTFGESLRVEFACLAEFTQFIRRHRRYFTIFLLLYWHSLFAWRARRGMRVAFCLAQRMDDILDGDRAAPEPPLVAAARLRAQLCTGHFHRDAEGLLARAVAWELDTRADGSESPLENFIALIDAMCRDRERIDARRMLDRAALDAHLADTFTRSLDLQLLLAGSRMRSRDVAPVIACFSRCSALRDLEEDLAHGLVNVPRDVLAACGIQELPGHVRQLRLQPAFHDWIRQATKQSLIALDDTDTLIKHWPDSNDPGVRVLRIFTRSMRDFFTRRARRLYPEAFETTIAS